MLFRDQGESGSDAGAVGTGFVSQREEDDETESTGGRSYTSAESASAQSFEQRMAKLNYSMQTMPDLDHGLDLFQHASSVGGGASSYLSRDYQLFGEIGGVDTDTDSEADSMDDSQRSRSLVLDAMTRNTCVSVRSTQHNGSPEKRSPDCSSDKGNEEENKYLETLLSNIDKHAARLDTTFYRYPPSDVIKQQMVVTAPLDEAKTKGRAAALSNGAASASSNDVAVSAGTDGVAEDNSGAENALSRASAPSHHPGTKLFLGGLRYEVIQSGRHMVCWIFQVACSVRLSPSSILIHRKTKNGRSNVAPTGCASVFVSNEEDVEALLGVNQRIYCAEEGVYVSPSPEVMRELIASKDIVDVTAGRVRGPIHPVVIERANSFRHHHHSSQREGGSGISSSTRGLGSNRGATAAGSGRGHRHARAVSFGRTESSASSEHCGSMPPPYGGGIPPPQYGSPSDSSLPTPVGLQPQSHTPSSVSSSVGMGSAPMAGGLSAREGSTALYPSSSVLTCESSTSTHSMLGDAMMPCPGSPPNAGGPQRITFHAYLSGDTASHMSTRVTSSSVPVAATPHSATDKHTSLFVAALPSETTRDYVSWLFSLMSITLPPSHVQLICGNSSSPMVTAPPGGVAPAGFIKKMVDSSATVNLDDTDISIALNYHHRVLCTPRGAWIGYSSQDIATLRASDASLRDIPPLYVGRRICAPALAGVEGSSVTAPAASGYPYGGAGCEFGSGTAMPYSPMAAAYSSPVFGGMPIIPTTAMGAVGNGMPFSMPWGLVMPTPSSHCMHPPGMPPPPPQSVMMGGAVPSAAGTGSSISLPRPPQNLSMPQQGIPGVQPPFPLAQSVTIGDRVYQLPPGATLQFLPVITSASAPRTGGGSTGEWRSPSPDRGITSNVKAPGQPKRQ